MAASVLARTRLFSSALCRTITVAMAANRHQGVRASVPWNEETARLSREHNDSNVLALGARTLPEGEPEKILKVWLETPFGGGRHERRVRKIDQE